MTKNNRGMLISKYINTPQGAKVLAASMMQPLRGRRYCKHNKEIKNCKEKECLVESIMES